MKLFLGTQWSIVGFVYRFISTGTIEEKIYQRQASKQSLSASIVDQVDNGELQFSGNELKKLFLFKEGTLCETHDTFKCKRCKNGKQILKAQALLYGDASTYVTYSPGDLNVIDSRWTKLEPLW